MRRGETRHKLKKNPVKVTLSILLVGKALIAGSESTKKKKKAMKLSMNMTHVKGSSNCSHYIYYESVSEMSHNCMVQREDSCLSGVMIIQRRVVGFSCGHHRRI